MPPLRANTARQARGLPSPQAALDLLRDEINRRHRVVGMVLGHEIISWNFVAYAGSELMR